MEWGDDLDSKIQLGPSLSCNANKQSSDDQILPLVLQHSLSTRFTRELHDNILQELFVISLRLEAVETTGFAIRGCKRYRQHRGRLSSDIRALIENSQQLGTHD